MIRSQKWRFWLSIFVWGWQAITVRATVFILETYKQMGCVLIEWIDAMPSLRTSWCGFLRKNGWRVYLSVWLILSNGWRRIRLERQNCNVNIAEQCPVFMASVAYKTIDDVNEYVVQCRLVYKSLIRLACPNRSLSYWRGFRPVSCV